MSTRLTYTSILNQESAIPNLSCRRAPPGEVGWLY